MNLIWFCALSLIFPSKALPEVIVQDTIAIKGEDVVLAAETRGRFFKRGGEVVEFFVDRRSLGKVLSGGDGVAFKTFLPKKASLYRIAVKAGQDEGHGLLLSLEKGSRIVFVDVEASLMEELFSGKSKQGSQAAVRDIQRRFPVVFLQTGPLSAKQVKEWLKEHGFIKSPLLPWKQGAVFDDMIGKGFRIRAIIGGPDVIESAKGYTTSAFSFEEEENAREVKDWEEIRKTLR
ncbi:MAG TPA: hypothetical protein DCP92_02645 [Nitrospiraceae bacterium]|jgi:hypothetical protein|nr:hypothetical protein [Nitrospiraceae bacterium]